MKFTIEIDPHFMKRTLELDNGEIYKDCLKYRNAHIVAVGGKTLEEQLEDDDVIDEDILAAIESADMGLLWRRIKLASYD